MKKLASLCLFILLFVILSGSSHGAAAPPTVENVVHEKSDSFSCSFDGVRHSILLDLPEHTEGAPLVLMLPGYGNTAEAFRSTVHFEEAANPLGYAVAWVTGAPDPNSPTSSIGWHYEASTDGNRDVEFLVSLAAYLQDSYSLDSTRTYAVGFSNGALMVHRLAVEATDAFSACVSVAGMMHESVWEQRREASPSGQHEADSDAQRAGGQGGKTGIGFFQITGEKDDVVPKNCDGSARYAKAPAIEDVIAWWADSGGLDRQETVLFEDGSVLTKYSSSEVPQQVWHLFVSDGRHSWPNGQFRHPDANTLILEFFEAQVPVSADS